MIQERIERVQEKQSEIEASRATMTARLKEFGQVLPSSSGDLELLRAALAQQTAQVEDDLGKLSQDYENKAGEKQRLATAIPPLKTELGRVSQQAGNIPHEADQLRQRIADGAKVPAGRLRYIGELLDIPAEHRGWERAILTIIRPLASDLLVPSEDFKPVRAWVNSHSIGGDITLVPGRAAGRCAPTSLGRSRPCWIPPPLVPTRGGSARNWSGSPTCAWKRTPTSKGPAPAG